MAIKSVVVSILCIIIAGCTSLTSVEDNQTERQAIVIYNRQGNVKEHVIIKDDYITIYDKNWKSKGYGKIKDDYITIYDKDWKSKGYGKISD